MVATSTALGTLRRCSLFARLAVESLEALARHAQERRFAPGDVILRQAEVGSGLFLIASGRVRVFRVSEEGQQASLDILGPGECIGELAVLDSGSGSASAIAMDDVACVYLPGREVVSALEQSPAAMWALVGLLCRRLRRADDRFAAFAFNDVHGRVAARLLELARSQGVVTDSGIEIELNLTQRELASLVGATRESVNKILSFHRQRGHVAMRGQRISILEPEALARRSCG
ncbi:MAG: Crp/Fnr family transcriptional regulator [Chloroflexi bacterium]|nr:Crp/Fnr family transcriptional regulator [Chloroflexota bacterium]